MLSCTGEKQSPTVVSITPIRVEADSRSLKIAATIAHMGYVSILVEGQKSHFDKNRLPFQLRSIGSMPGALRADIPDHPRHGHWNAAIWKLRLELRETPSPVLFLIMYLLRQAIIPLRHIPRASLYYLHGLHYFPAVYLLCKRWNSPLIYDAHDFYSEMRIPSGVDAHGFCARWVATFYQYIESRIIKQASAVVTVSEGVAKLQEKTFGCRPIVIRNFHDLRLDHDSGKHLRDVLGLSSQEFVIVSVGNAKEGAAISQALHAVAGLSSRIHLAFVGAGYEAYMDDISRQGLATRVHVLKPVKPYEVVPFIRGADAAIILYYPRSPNYAYSLPNRFFQPLAAGLPLLYPELPEIKRMAEKYDVGIPIDPQNPKSISSAITKLANDPSAVAKYKRNLIKARNELSWENEELILRDLISRVLLNRTAKSSSHC
jgi:glycosyltransferase involved in cell wall biosynthesis